MALPKLFQRIFWHNNTTPAINEDNLNAMSKGLDDVDDRLIELAGTIMEDVPVIQHDLEILEPAIENIDANVTRAETAADNAEADALKSEGYAVGTQDGVEVTSGEYYQNNAKYYAEIANPPIENTVDFTDIITISDAINKAAKDVRLKVEAVQDLHGYDKPWVGGMGKNLIPMTVAGIKALNTSGTWSGNIYTVNNTIFNVLTDGGDNVTGILVNRKPSSTWAEFHLGEVAFVQDTSYKISSGTTGSTNSTYRLWTTSSRAFPVGHRLSTDENLGENIAQVAYASEPCDVILAVNTNYTPNNLLIKPMVYLGSISDTSFEPYTNICPITGHSEANVYRDGLNVWDEQTESGGYSSSGSPYSDADLIRSKNYIPVKAGVYYFSANTSGIRVCGYDSNKNFIAVCPVSNNTFTIVDGMSFIRFHINKNVGNICINLSNPSKNGQYEPYMGEVFTINLDGTYYGGTLDVTSGVLTLDTKNETVTFSEVYVRASNPNCDYAIFALADAWDASFNDTLLNTFMSNEFGGKASGFDTESEVGRVILYDRSTKRLGVTVPKGYTLVQAQTLFSGAVFVHKIQTPQTIQLTPTQVYLLYGYNTLLGDCGDISLTYDASGIIHIEEAKLDTETLKTIAAASSDFADFKARIAAL